MGLTKQAKTLNPVQIKGLLGHLADTRNPKRNKVIFLLSVKAGLRAKEIAMVSWPMLTNSDGQLGDALALQNTASKGKKGGRKIPLHPELKAALADLAADTGMQGQVIKSERRAQTSPEVIANMLDGWYKAMGWAGCSSHSGRRTFITNAAKKLSLANCTLRDVQLLAGHSSLATTQRYIEADTDGQRKLVGLI